MNNLKSKEITKFIEIVEQLQKITEIIEKLQRNYRFYAIETIYLSQ